MCIVNSGSHKLCATCLQWSASQCVSKETMPYESQYTLPDSERARNMSTMPHRLGSPLNVMMWSCIDRMWCMVMIGSLPSQVLVVDTLEILNSSSVFISRCYIILGCHQCDAHLTDPPIIVSLVVAIQHDVCMNVYMWWSVIHNSIMWHCLFCCNLIVRPYTKCTNPASHIPGLEYVLHKAFRKLVLQFFHEQGERVAVRRRLIFRHHCVQVPLALARARPPLSGAWKCSWGLQSCVHSISTRARVHTRYLECKRDSSLTRPVLVTNHAIVAWCVRDDVCVFL